MHSETIATTETAQLLLREIGKPHLLQYFGDRLNVGLDLPTRPQLIRAYAQLAGTGAKELLKQIVANSEEMPISQSIAIEMLADLELAASTHPSVDVIEAITAHLDTPANQVLSAAAGALVKLDVQTSANKLRNLLVHGKLDPSVEDEVRTFVQNTVATSVDQIIPPIPENSVFERKEELHSIRDALEVEGGSHIVALCGMPGVGKTILAAWYARRAPFDLVFWFAARHQTDEADFLGRLVQQIDLQRPGTVSNILYKSLNEAFNPASMVQQLGTLLGEFTSLLVIDDFDASQHQRELGQLIESLINKMPKMRCLITSRRPPSHLKNMSVVLDTLSDDDAMRFIQQKMEEQNVDYSPELAKQILSISGQLPLAIQLAIQSLAAYGRLPQEKDQHSFLEAILSQSVDRLSTQQRRFLEILAYFEDGIDLNDSRFLVILKQEGIELGQSDIQALMDSALIADRPEGKIDVAHLLIREYFQQAVDQRTSLRTNRAAGEYYLAQSDILQAARNFALGEDYPRAIDEISRSLRTLINQGHAQEVLRLLSEEFQPSDSDQRVELERLSIIGNLLHLLGELKRADQVYETAVAIGRSLDDLESISNNSIARGNIYLDLGQLETAINFFQQGLEIKRQIGDYGGIGVTLGNLGNAYSSQGRSSEAIDHYKQALHVSREIGDKIGEATWLGNLGNLYADLGRMKHAIDHFQQALAISRQIGDRYGQGTHLGNLGVAYRNLGRINEAITFYEEALIIAREIGYKDGEGNWLGYLGIAYADLGRFQEAIDYYEQALATAREISNRRSEGSNLGNLGAAYADLGHVKEAIAYYQQALEIAREIGDRRGESNRLGNLGAAYADLGHVKEAIAYYQQALEIAREIGDRRGESNRLGSLGVAYAGLGHIEEAIAYYQQALEIAREIGDRRGESNRLGNLGAAYADLGRIEEAVAYYQQALEIAREIGDRRGESNRLGSLGAAYTDLGRIEEAIAYYQQALEIAREIGDLYGIAANSAGLGALYHEQQNDEQASSYAAESYLLYRNAGFQEAMDRALKLLIQTCGSSDKANLYLQKMTRQKENFVSVSKSSIDHLKEAKVIHFSSHAVFNQSGQTVQGNQINIAGDVHTFNIDDSNEDKQDIK